MKKVLFLVGLIFLFSHAVVVKQSTLMSEAVYMKGMKGECSQKEQKQLLEDAKCFPVQDAERMSYDNGYGDGRSYGGKRKHEGIDIIPEKQRDDYYAVVSVTDGIVEQIGWLELGGYRVGIRSSNGFYFYYAHLASYQDRLKKGKKIHAGEVIGFMGNTGYGAEGTKGKFIIHLHFGIYRKVDGEERCFNPYFLLKYLQSYRSSKVIT